jgi:hypothetical protein
MKDEIYQISRAEAKIAKIELGMQAQASRKEKFDDTIVTIRYIAP